MSWLWTKKADDDSSEDYDDDDDEEVDDDEEGEVMEEAEEEEEEEEETYRHMSVDASNDEHSLDNQERGEEKLKSDDTPPKEPSRKDTETSDETEIIPEDESVDEVMTDDDGSAESGDSSDDEDEDYDSDDSDDDDGYKKESRDVQIQPNGKRSTGRQNTFGQPPMDKMEDKDQEEAMDVNNEHEKDQEDEEEEEEEQVTSFSEKQSLLILAAEHDRVDILKAILTDEDADKDKLMNSGIPPLHIAISFGSTNATQSLLRMGADPSIRPNVKEIKREQALLPEGSKVEIPNISRFDGASAWELAFGNGKEPKRKKSWLFGGGSGGDAENGEPAKRVIKPVDLSISKREGIRHAFTAEALRCIGGDEVQRLEHLLNSGMPSSIDIGGKDLYGWAVEMGALACEELLRPSEAAKHGTQMPNNDGHEDTNSAEKSPKEARARVLDRSHPGDESVPHLMNRLDELESLARALSTCLDNLAEEVSVCHGLLLMGGGATALASHVKSLKEMLRQKELQLYKVQREWEVAEEELALLVKATGEIGEEIARIAPTKFLRQSSNTFSRNLSFSSQDEESNRQQLLAQIAASENKVRQFYEVKNLTEKM